MNNSRILALQALFILNCTLLATVSRGHFGYEVIFDDDLLKTVNSDFCAYGCPFGVSNSSSIVKEKIYILSSNKETKFADWVAYRVTKDGIDGTGPKRSRYHLVDDPRIDRENRLGLMANDFTFIGLQGFVAEGLVPVESFSGSEHWASTSSLSNIVPQKESLSIGAWKTLESRIGNLLEEWDEGVYVMAGTLYETEMREILTANTKHKVPSGFWKIVIVVPVGPQENGLLTAGFIFNQDIPAGAKPCDKDYVTSIDEIENRTGLDFLHELDKSKQDAVEQEDISIPLLQFLCK